MIGFGVVAPLAAFLVTLTLQLSGGLSGVVLPALGGAAAACVARKSGWDRGAAFSLAVATALVAALLVAAVVYGLWLFAG